MSEVFVFDSGALGAMAQDDPRMRRLLRDIVRDGGVIRVPSVVLAECYGDPRYHPRYDRALDALGGAERAVVATSISIAKEAGRILRDAGMHETIDAIVVATAAVFRSPATVVTGDASHIQDLACCVPHDVGVIQLNELPGGGSL